MSGKVIAILEVSQKQAFIFSSNKLKDNVANSAIIAWVTSKEYLQEVSGATGLFDEKENLIYAGGGHTVLEFADREKAEQFMRMVTVRVREEYPGLELFVKLVDCGEKIRLADLDRLTKELEKKKSRRRAAFHQGSFGVEEVDSVSLDPVLLSINGKIVEREIPQQEKDLGQSLMPAGDYIPASSFEELGGSRNESNFIAVVHIDGNGMGKRVTDFRKHLSECEEEKGWKYVKDELGKFSQRIDDDFKAAYVEMTEVVSACMKKGRLDKLGLKSRAFPVRRIITAGDDICFVTEGRIGIECARIFLEKLHTKPSAECGYTACAGVAIVHRKYPFYRAYELAEMLCSNAKSYIATTGGVEASAEACAIDWHIEFGDLKGSVDEIREDYIATDGSHMELRPYLVIAPDELIKKDLYRRYGCFKQLMAEVQNGSIKLARGKLKNLRSYLRKGEADTKHYLVSSGMGDLNLLGTSGIYWAPDMALLFSGKGQKAASYITASDGKQHSLFYDAIELLDTYISLDEEREK